MWNIFRKYHYLNTDLHPAATQYIGVWNNEIVCHTGVIQFPMRKGWKRVHRLVVLPDYQGIGIGTKFIEAIANMYVDGGYVFNLTTTTPSLIFALAKNPRWLLKRYGRDLSGRNAHKRYKEGWKHLVKSLSTNRITFSFYYNKEENNDKHRD